MKVIYICFLLLVTGIANSFSQTERGTRYLGLTLGLGGSNEERTGDFDRSTSVVGINVGPSYSYLFADKWELRAGLGLALSRNKLEENNSEHKYTRYSITPSLAVQRHLMLSDKLGFVTGPFVAYHYEHTNDNPSYERRDTYSKMFSTGIGLDIEFFPVKQLGLRANLLETSFSRYKTNAMVDKMTNFSAGISKNLYLSIFYVFGKAGN